MWRPRPPRAEQLPQQGTASHRAQDHAAGSDEECGQDRASGAD